MNVEKVRRETTLTEDALLIIRGAIPYTVWFAESGSMLVDNRHGGFDLMSDGELSVRIATVDHLLAVYRFNAEGVAVEQSVYAKPLARIDVILAVIRSYAMRNSA